MKKILLTLIVLTLGLTTATAQRVKPSAYASYVSLIKEGKGTVMVRSNGWGKNEAQALQDAEVRAILTLLYVGLPQAQRLQALVPNEQEANDSNPQYFETLVTNQGYKRFVSESYPSGSFTKMKGEKTKSMAVDITINIESLKKDLENNKIIRRFGF